MAAELDPFSLVYNELWSMMEEDQRFEVKAGNKLKFNENDRNPGKTNLSSADYPEVALMAENISGNLCNTSSTSMIRRNFSWVVSSGDYRYTEIFPLEWSIFTGMLAWRYRLTALRWEGQQFVINCNLNDSNFNQIDAMRRRGVEGWIAVWSIYVEMHFATSTIVGSHLET